eukprot:GHVQ01023948.1.p1 GENE.GHVQ01023948.1~~GHVQ01023948.1.p1  ORF type:complete len:612 (+),score=136.70 GHVQ01023948.1:122-1957(+)
MTAAAVPPPTPPSSSSSPPSTSSSGGGGGGAKKASYGEVLVYCLNLLYTSVVSKDARLSARVLRQLRQLRNRLDVRVLSAMLQLANNPESRHTSPVGSYGGVGSGCVTGSSILSREVVRRAEMSLVEFVKEADIKHEAELQKKKEEEVEQKKKAEEEEAKCKLEKKPEKEEKKDKEEKKEDKKEKEEKGGGGADEGQTTSQPQDEKKSVWKVRSTITGEIVEEVVISDAKYGVPEAEAFLVLLVVLYHIDNARFRTAMELCDLLPEALEGVNRRSMDVLTARAYFYCSLAYERSGELKNIRARLLRGLRFATIHHDYMTQATTLNLLLRNYLHYQLYDLALKLVSKASYPECLRSNAQYARYLFYLGRIQAVQLEYADAHSKLMQASRKAPQSGCIGRGFRLIATKMAIVVELLLGDIPERQIFTNHKDMRIALGPYEQMVQAVRSGDVHLFREVMNNHRQLFQKDSTLYLLRRLHHNVIRAGLRRISLSYSKIHLVDIAEKLCLDSATDAECIVSKSIMDGVIDAEIDHKNQFVSCHPSVDLYTSSEPIKAYHKRIAFCLQLHSEAVKAMQYPEEEDDKTEEAEARRQRMLEEIERAEGDEFSGDEMDMM